MKRVIDVVGAAAALVILSPLVAITALVVRVRLGKPVIFAQSRPGRDTKPFTLFKFRTMREEYDYQGRLLSDERRLTRLGHLLRSTSIDELPELVNVLRGDMSLVGPRPLLMSYVERYTAEQARRHEVRPGITGLAQVSGRNALSWEERFQLDVWYVEHHNTWVDLRILVKTVMQVVRRRDIAHDGHATMTEFQGSAPGRPERAEPTSTGDSA